MIKTLHSITMALLISTPFFAPMNAAAAEIVLTSPDNTVMIKGEFAGFQQDTYIVIYNGYKLQVPAALMTCQGEDCFAFESRQPAFVEGNGS